VHVFDIITQYRAIFPDDSLSTPASPAPRDSRESGVGILHSWLTQKISEFADTLSMYVFHHPCSHMRFRSPLA
jgi:hypothetical protein